MKTKKLFIVGIAMFVLLIAFIAFNMSVDLPDAWNYDVTWIIFYVYSSLMVLVFILHAVFRGIYIAKNKGNWNTGEWAGFWGGIGCALLTFELCFIWFVINRPTLSGPPFMRVACALYFFITATILLVAALLKIMSRE